jgi:hypothetical protein
LKKKQPQPAEAMSKLTMPPSQAKRRHIRAGVSPAVPPATPLAGCETLEENCLPLDIMHHDVVFTRF